MCVQWQIDFGRFFGVVCVADDDDDSNDDVVLFGEQPSFIFLRLEQIINKKLI